MQVRTPNFHTWHDKGVYLVHRLSKPAQANEIQRRSATEVYVD